MVNQLVLVGRVANLTKTERKTIIILAVPRFYKNAEGIYETDFIDCQLFGNVAKNTIEYCRIGDMVGIKGRLQSNNKKINVVVDTLTFLTSGCNKNINIEEE